MFFWNILAYTDFILYVLVSLTVVYMAVFALASLLRRHSDTPKSRKQNRFIILIPAYRNGSGAIRTVLSALGQDYPQRLFDITVVSDHCDELSNFKLAQQPVTLLTPNFKKSSRVKAFQVAINNLPQFKIYDVAIVLNAGNVVEQDFLSRINEAYEAAGTKAIQAHLVSRNRDTASARLSAIFEEINNSIFRRGHITLGLSSSTIGSAMAFDFEWFSRNIRTAQPNLDDKALEILLIRQHIYIDYFDNIIVYDEKSRLAEDFNRQHRRWVMSQLNSVIRNIRYLPGAILARHYDLTDKILQWMLMPRMVMMAIIILECAVMPFIYFSLAIKWWALFAIVMLVFAIATPNYLVDDKWNRTFFLVPVILMSSLLAHTTVGKRMKAYVNQKL